MSSSRDSHCFVIVVFTDDGDAVVFAVVVAVGLVVVVVVVVNVANNQKKTIVGLLLGFLQLQLLRPLLLRSRFCRAALRCAALLLMLQL